MSATSPNSIHMWDDGLPEWLSPSLVKELRQALRSKIFVGVFLWVTCSMSLLLVIETMVAAGSGDDRTMRFCAGCFWMNVSLVLSVLLPVRGLTSGMEELQPSSLDFLRLTGTEAGGVIMSKWMAMLGLSFLIVSSLLPFALLRYHFGGMNIQGEVLMLCWTWIGGLVLTSFAILMATLSIGARIVAGCISTVVMLPVLLGPSIAMLVGGFRHPANDLIPAFLWVPVAGLLIMLSLGGAAGRLADDHFDAAPESTVNEFHRW
jgi:hypothetical protein